MDIDPATVCARTSAGEAELEKARNGLTLPQRKALSLLTAPRAYAEFAEENHLDPERLARDFVRLGELGLITLQLGSVVLVAPVRARAANTPARAAPTAPRAARSEPGIPAAARTDPQLQPVVIGAVPGRSPMRLAALAGAAVIAVTAGWLALREGPQATALPVAANPAPAPVPLSLPTVASVPAPAPQEAAPVPVVAPAPLVPSTGTTGRPAATDIRSSGRDAPAHNPKEPRPAANAPIPPAAEPDTTVAVAQPAARPTTSVATAVAGERATEPAASSPTTTPVPVPAPVLVASAAKTTAGAMPSLKGALQPIVRDAPEFPKEAMTEGVTHGTVTARVTVDANGKVAGIEIIDAQPRRVFDRAVRAALWRWQFEPGAPNRTTEIEIAFARQ